MKQAVLTDARGSVEIVDVPDLPGPGLVPLDELRQSGWNPRTITGERLQALMDSIKADPHLMARRPILADVNGNVYAGNQRLHAVKLLYSQGWKSPWGAGVVPAMKEDLTLEEQHARALRDNNGAGEWDEDALAELLTEMRSHDPAPDGASHSAGLGWTEEDVQAILDDARTREEERKAEAAAASSGQTTPDVDPDRREELAAKWETAEGQLWLIPSRKTPGRCHRLLVGNGTKVEDVAALMRGERAQMIFTDPPYGVQFQGTGGVSISGDLTYTAIPLFFSHIPDVLAPGAWAYVCGGWANISLYAGLFERYFRLVPRLIVWDKQHQTMRHNGYHSAFELIFLGYMEGGGATWYGSRAGEGATDLWRVPLGAEDKIDGDRLHAAQKPTELPRRALLNSCPVGAVVWEPFAGSGGVVMAAEDTGRICYASEVDPPTAAVVLERCELLGLTPICATQGVADTVGTRETLDQWAVGMIPPYQDEEQAAEQTEGDGDGGE